MKEFYKLPEEVRRNYVVHFDINVINEFGVRYENLSLRHSIIFNSSGYCCFFHFRWNVILYSYEIGEKIAVC